LIHSFEKPKRAKVRVSASIPDSVFTNHLR
jgi:hypothetical protein